MDKDELIAMLVKQLEQDDYELATLQSRVTNQFEASIARVRANIKAALAAAKKD